MHKLELRHGFQALRSNRKQLLDVIKKRVASEELPPSNPSPNACQAAPATSVGLFPETFLHPRLTLIRAPFQG